MLLFSYYIDDKMDRAWFDSSNVLYGECDESDTQFKTVRIVFKNGSQYQYDGVLVADWVSFKNAQSQGKALNEHFKKAGYKYTKLDNANTEEIMEEYSFRSGRGYTLVIDGERLKLVDNSDKELYSMEYPGKDITDSIKGMLESLGNVVKIKED